MTITPDWNKQRQTVLEDRYLLTDEEGELIEDSKEELWDRLSSNISNISELSYEEYYSALEDFKLVPAGRQLYGIGNPGDVSFFNCFVIPFHLKNKESNQGLDSREAIMDTMSSAVEITARGGGIGLNWSVLRPKDSYIKGVNGHSSGSISWMQAFNNVIKQVEQGGSRRGAQMYLLEDWHPDILEFITCKKDREILNEANLSVGISDEFMEAVKNNEEWELKFPDIHFDKYDEEWEGDIREWEEKGYPVEVYNTIPAREIWDKICELAWENGEPGVVFLERYNKQATTRYLERVLTTNPCGFYVSLM